MTTLQTLTPTASSLVTGSGSPWSVVGAASAHAALADADNNSYINHPFSDDNPTCNLTAFTDYTMSASERCRAVRVAGYGFSDFGIIGSASGVGSYIQLGSGWNNPMNEVGAWDPDNAGVEWSQAAINALTATILGSNAVGGFNGSRVMQFVIQLDIMTKPPAPTINSPTLDQVTPLRPTISWTYVGGGDLQKKYRIKIFTDAVVTGGGFDPDTSTSVYDSTLSGSGTSAVIGSDLSPGVTYQVFMKVAKDFNGADWFSDWSSGRRFIVNSRPVAVVVAPTGVVSATNKPLIDWTYSDTNSDLQSHYRVRVFEQPGGTWVGFDPDVATPFWDSGEVASSDTSVTMPVALNNLKTLRAYVKVKHSSPVELESLWAFSDFTTNFAAAAVPTISAIAYEDKVEIKVTPGTPIVPAADWINVERSLDAGVTWALFRYGTLALSENFSPAAAFSITDYEVPLGLAVQYRAYSVTTALGDEINSVASVTSATAFGRVVWMKDPSDSSLGRHFMIEDQWLSFTRRRGRTTVQALGRDKPVVIRGSGQGVAFSITLLILGDNDYLALEELLLADRTLYVQTPKGSWYAEVAGDVTELMHLWDSLQNEEDARRITIPFIEVDF